jgi:hypothetical protein
VRRYFRVLPTDVKAVDKRQCQPQFQEYFCNILFFFQGRIRSHLIMPYGRQVMCLMAALRLM